MEKTTETKTTTPMMMDARRKGQRGATAAEASPTTIEPSIVTSFPDIIGDTPVYDAANRRLLWVDTARGQVHEVAWDESSTRRLGRTWQVASWATAVVPRASGGFVVAANRDIVGVTDEGDGTLIASLPNEGRPRWKDLNCDPQGRLIGGWVPDDHSGPGEVVRLDPGSRRFETILSGVTLATGVDWSLDGSIMYLSDSYARTVDAFDYDAQSGAISERRTVITVEHGAGVPDGIAVDDEGCIWLAVPWSGEVRRYTAEGELLTTIRMPTATPIAIEFAGPDGDELFITSSWLKTPRSALLRAGVTDELIEVALSDSFGGTLFVCRPGISGPPGRPFAG